MAVLLRNNAVFLHIPKTGGSWVTEVLESNGLVRRKFSHIHADLARAQTYSYGTKLFMRSMFERIKSRVPNKIKSTLWSLPARQAQAAKIVAGESRRVPGPFCFCFVRHPLSWYESWWRYMYGIKGADWSDATDLLRWHPCGALRQLGNGDFNEFVRNVIRERPGFVTELYGRYVPRVNGFVGRQEHLLDDLVGVLQRLELDFDEDRIRHHNRVNVSKTQTKEAVVWEPELRAEVERLEYAGLVQYGYGEAPFSNGQSTMDQGVAN